MVDHGSDLFYNFTALMEVHKDKEPEPQPEQPSSSNPTHPSHSQQPQYTHQTHPSELNGSFRDLPPQQFANQGYQNGAGGMVQLQQAPQHINPAALGMGNAPSNFGSDVYIPPDTQRNPRRTTRGANGREGMYRV